jgi:hypothetical protein
LIDGLSVMEDAYVALVAVLYAYRGVNHNYQQPITEDLHENIMRQENSPKFNSVQRQMVYNNYTPLSIPTV